MNAYKNLKRIEKIIKPFSKSKYKIIKYGPPYTMPKGDKKCFIFLGH